MARIARCSDCDSVDENQVTRRQFVSAMGATAAAAATLPTLLGASEKTDARQPEALVKKLYDSLTDEQKKQICFDWNHTDKRGLLRTHVSNNWSITNEKYAVGGEFFTADQQDLIEAIFFKLYNPEWHDRILQQLKDDAGGYGKKQTIAIFGEPGTDQFEFVMTGRHLTIRCDGDSAEHVAFGGPIFYGHAAKDFNEKPNHPGNVFWPQALEANKLYQMLDGKQRKLALLPTAKEEDEVAFQGADGKISGIRVSDLASDQKEHVQKVLSLLLEPYRVADRDEVARCLQAQGGLDQCKLAFFQEDDLGNDEVWDIWRLEGPSFVWHFRGAPHVHVWVNVADNPAVKLNAKG